MVSSPLVYLGSFCTTCLVGHGRLKLVNLILAVTKILEHTLQLALILRTLFHPRNSFVHPWWPTDEDLDVFLFRTWNGILQQLLRHMSLPVRPALRRRVDSVECAKSLWVLILQLPKLFLEENVFFGQVTKDQGHLGLVGWILEDPACKLEHRCDASATCDQSNVVVLVCRPRILGNWTFEVEALAGRHAVHVFGHRAIWIAFDQQVKVTTLICPDQSACTGLDERLAYLHR